MALLNHPTQQAPILFDYKLDQTIQNYFYLPLVCAKLIEKCPAASSLL